MVQVSIVIPMKNEGQNIGALIADILTACATDDIEVIDVDDASTDDSMSCAR